MAQAAGPHFRVVSASTKCENCVSRVDITSSTDGSGEYTLQTGDESTHSRDCAELVKIAGFTVRSSHIHQEPAPTAPFLFLGLHAGQLIADDLQWVFGGQVGVRITDNWLVRPHVGWTPESRVTLLLADGDLDPRFTAYQGGLDVCRAITGWVSVCAQSELEWFSVTPNPGWEAEVASQGWLGLGATFQANLVSDYLLLQLQPAVLVAPRPASVRESDWSATLYERPQVQVQLRAGLAWALGGSGPSDGSRSNFAQSAGSQITH